MTILKNHLDVLKLILNYSLKINDKFNFDVIPLSPDTVSYKIIEKYKKGEFIDE